MRIVTGSALVMATVLLTVRVLGQMPIALSNFGVIVLILSFSLLNLSAVDDRDATAGSHQAGRLERRRQAMLLVGALIFFAAYLLVPSNIYLIRLFAISLFCFFSGKTIKNADEGLASVCWVLALTIFSFGILYFLYHTESAIWFAFQMLSQESSRLIGSLTRQQLLLNVSASGILITLLSLILGLFTFVLSVHRRWLHFAVCLSALMAGNAIFIATLHPLYIWVQKLISIQRFNIMDLPVVLFLFDIVPIYFLLKKAELRKCSFDKLFPIRWKSATSVAILSIGVALLVFHQQSGTTLDSSTSGKTKTILIYSKGYLNWEKPQFGNYGLQSTGMFGMFSMYLDAMGYNVRIDSNLTGTTLDNSDIVVVINLASIICANEKERLRQFISRGGSLLVLGDHTGLGGIMEPLNDLLQFTEIRYRFDCGHWLVDDWKDAFDIPQHPIFRGIHDENDIAISIGASLDISPVKATPVLLARYGFSDIGNPFNEGNAYLGNRAYDTGELLGDNILIASENYGKGKVLVFGDTSPFQNGALTYSFQFVRNVFDYLSTRNSGLEEPLRWASLFLVIMGSVLLFTIGKGLREPFNLIGVMVVVSLIWLVSMSGRNPQFAVQKDKSPLPVAYIDASHLNRFSEYGDDGIWPLTNNLMRNRYLPFVCRQFSPALLEQSSVAFFIAPAEELSGSEMKELDSYMQHGGTVIWSVGEEHIGASTEVLGRKGLAMENIPLGPVSDSTADVRFVIKDSLHSESSNNLNEPGVLSAINHEPSAIYFHSAWPIVVAGSSKVDTLCTGWGYPIIISEPVSKGTPVSETSTTNGKFVLISDSGFLLNDNLESKTMGIFGRTISGANVMAFRALLQKVMAHRQIARNP